MIRTNPIQKTIKHFWDGSRAVFTNSAWRNATLVLWAAVMLTGCTAVLLDVANQQIFQDNDILLPQKNHAAADVLISQAHTHLTEETPIAVAPLSELLQPEITSAFGAVVTEQAGVRLSQLGYNVQLEYVSAYTDVRAPTPQAPEILLAGTYNPRHHDVSISLRMINLNTKRIIGSFDYVIPLTREIEDLIVPQPRVFKLSP